MPRKMLQCNCVFLINHVPFIWTSETKMQTQRHARLLNRVLQDTSGSIASNRCNACFDSPLPKFSLLMHQGALERIHQDVLVQCSDHRDFFQLLLILAPVMKSKTNCCSEMHQLVHELRDVCLGSPCQFLRLLLFFSPPQLHVPPLLSLFLAAPAVLVRPPLHLVVPHQHVQVWDPAVLSLHHVVAIIPRIACELTSICVSEQLQFFVSSNVEPSRNGFWFSLIGNPWKHVGLWNNGFQRREEPAVQHARLSSLRGIPKCSNNQFHNFSVTGMEGMQL